MLRKGEVDAIVAIEGKPLQWLNQINDRNLHLVPVDYAKPLHEEYLPSKLSSADYPNLVAEGRRGRDDRSRGRAGGLQLGAEQRPLPPPVAAGGHDVRQGRRSCSGRRSIRSGRNWRRGRRWPAGPASRRRRTGSTATCPLPRAGPAATGAASAPARRAGRRAAKSRQQQRDPLYREFLEQRASSRQGQRAAQ